MDDVKLKQLDLYKGLYETELKRKDEIDKQVGFPVTVLTILIGSFSFVFRQYTERPVQHPNWLDLFFGLACLGFIVPVAVTVYYLVRVFHEDDRTYDYLPYAKRLNEYRDELIAFHEQHPEVPAEASTGYGAATANASVERITKDFNLSLLNYYADCSSKNGTINDSRSESFYSAKQYMVRCIYTFLIVFFTGFINYFMNEKPTQQPSATPPPVSKPTPPPAREVRENPDTGREVRIQNPNIIRK